MGGSLCGLLFRLLCEARSLLSQGSLVSSFASLTRRKEPKYLGLGKSIFSCLILGDGGSQFPLGQK